MTTLNLETIPAKFHPSVINRDDFADQELKEKVQAAFANRVPRTLVDNAKDYVFRMPGLEGYIVKSKRTDAVGQVETPDTHLYRVRKADKIQKLITKYGLGDHAQVPTKLLYFHNGEWFIIAQELQLTDEVPKVNVEAFSGVVDQLRDLPSFHGRVTRGLTEQGKSITPEQARALVIFAYEAGLTDLTNLNLYFTTEGKIGVIDTEPVKRYFVKLAAESWSGKLLNNKGIIKATQACVGLAKLRVNLHDQAAIEQINKTEHYYLTIVAIKVIAIAAICALAITFSPAIPLTFAVLSIKIAAYTKLSMLSLQVMNLAYVYFQAHNTKNCEGVGKLGMVEQQGQL
ncbi:MAG: hypothetical protein P0S94_01615 [Simkaniaceae bacterium]|nr:hypothetical protein [Simkaniaceae bacterium]